MRVRAGLGGVAFLAALAVAAPLHAASPTGPIEPAKARLVPEASAIEPGATVWVDLHFDIAQGWHIYWRNPGDSGLPTEIAWKLPPGFAAGEIAWPAPERVVIGTIGNYGYAGTADLLVPVTAPKDLEPGGTAHVEAAASWLVCSDICIPGAAALIRRSCGGGRLVAGIAAGAARRAGAEPDALRLPGAVAEGAGACRGGASRRTAAPRHRLCRRCDPQLYAARGGAADSAHR